MSSHESPASHAEAAFPIDDVLEAIAEAVAEHPKAAMFELAERGHDTLFEQLVGCIISIRTRDEVTLPATLRLFERAATPQAIAALDEAAIVACIEPAKYARDKAGRIRELARRAVDEHRGRVPCDEATVRAFVGIGPKCANLALGIACGMPRVSVDVHVHRVTNRWGYVDAPTPEKTLAALEAKLPRRWWIDLNRLLVPFGKHICTGHAPHCSTCPVREPCQQIGVTKHR